jgi:hypothetical protein
VTVGFAVFRRVAARPSQSAAVISVCFSPNFFATIINGLKEFGRNKVHDQIQRVISIVKLCSNMDEFREKFARVLKQSPAQLSPFDFDSSK